MEEWAVDGGWIRLYEQFFRDPFGQVKTFEFSI